MWTSWDSEAPGHCKVLPSCRSGWASVLPGWRQGGAGAWEPSTPWAQGAAGRGGVCSQELAQQSSRGPGLCAASHCDG